MYMANFQKWLMTEAETFRGYGGPEFDRLKNIIDLNWSYTFS